jgi:MoaD family protein
MKVKVKFFTRLREITGKKVDTIEMQNSITIKGLIILLAKKYGKNFREYIFDNKGEVQEFFSFLVNGIKINNMQGYDTKLQDGDIVAILPPVGGG